MLWVCRPDPAPACLCPGGGRADSSWGWRWGGKALWSCGSRPRIQGVGGGRTVGEKRLQAPASLHPLQPPLHGPMTHCILVTKHNYKDKIIKNFKKMTAEHSSPSLGPSESGALCTCTGHRPMTPGQHPKPLRTPVSQSTRRFYILVAAISLRDP